MDQLRQELVHIRATHRPPEEYHCRCRLCVEGFRGILVRKDGSPYARTDRNKYYSPVERADPKLVKQDKKTSGDDAGGHVSKTPLHVARWAIQTFTKPGEWVLDPTMGAGTTAVESINHGRNVFGVEIQSIDVVEANIAHALEWYVGQGGIPPKYCVIHGDARGLSAIMDENIPDVRFNLVVNNPPYSGDERAHTLASLGKDPRSEDGRQSRKMFTVGYDRRYANLAFLKEGLEYWETMLSIYTQACSRLVVGGHFVVGVKDQMRNKKADELHRLFAEVLENVPGMKFSGVVILPHHPPTLFMNTYNRTYPTAAPCPRHQSVVVFEKVSEG